MDASGLVTDADVCSVLLKAAMRCSDVPRAEKVLSIMRDAGLQARALWRSAHSSRVCLCPLERGAG